MRGLVFSIALVLPCLADAVIYKCVDNSGEVIFSDRPCPGAEEIEIRVDPAPKPSPPPPGLADLRRKLNTRPSVSYETITITEPANDASIRANDGSFPVSVSLQPALMVAEGHKLVLMLDGKVIGESTDSIQFRVTEVERGTHTLRAKVVDYRGKDLAESDSIKVHIQRQSNLRPGSVEGEPNFNPSARFRPADNFPAPNFPAPNFPFGGPGVTEPR